MGKDWKGDIPACGPILLQALFLYLSRKVSTEAGAGCVITLEPWVVFHPIMNVVGPVGLVFPCAS